MTAIPAHKLPPPPWTGTGVYDVDRGTCIGRIIDHRASYTGNKLIDTDGFSLKVLHCMQTVPNRLYASFKFDKLEGLMQMGPANLMSRDFTKRKYIKNPDFGNICNLAPNTAPGPGHEAWCMRWRGTYGGKRLDKAVGGNDDGIFDFKNPATLIDSSTV